MLESVVMVVENRLQLPCRTFEVCWERQKYTANFEIPAEDEALQNLIISIASFDCAAILQQRK